MNSVDTFFIPQETEFLCHRWGDESIVYVTASGETHLLETAAADILLEIAAAPANFQQLKASLSAQYQEIPEAEITEYLTNTLQQFQSIELVDTAKE
ncbi:MAG: HPr-rel-A system PqqD family peptide chaperone [Porticoccaceae bacterium]